MSDESIQSGVIETQEMQAIQVLLDNYCKNSFEVACVMSKECLHCLHKR